MKQAALLTVIWILSSIALAKTPDGGMYARSATPVWERLASSDAQIHIPSPNKTHLLLATYYEFHESSGDAHSGVYLTLRNGTVELWKERIEPGVGIEISWSADSSSFFLTTSDGGRNGLYGTIVYFVERDRVSKVDLTPIIISAFGHPVKCGWPESPNVAGVRWLEPSRRILVAAEIVHHSNCDSYGTFQAYEISLPQGRIVKKYGQIEAKRLFRRDLGWEIKDAPDHCIRTPESCWVQENHLDGK